MADTITMDIQMAGYSFDQYDVIGEVSYSQFIDQFYKFPWASQVGQANGGSEATISLHSKDTTDTYFVSVIGDPNEYAYLIGFITEKEKRSFFGFGTPKKVRWLEMYVAEDPKSIHTTATHFFNNSKDKLVSYLKNLPLFLEQEAVK